MKRKNATTRRQDRLQLDDKINYKPKQLEGERYRVERMILYNTNELNSSIKVQLIFPSYARFICFNSDRGRAL